MKIKSILLLASVVLTASIVITIQSCKNDTAVETTPPENQNPLAPGLVSPNNQSTINTLSPTLLPIAYRFHLMPILPE
jgi:hypothetical protein